MTQIERCRACDAPLPRDAPMGLCAPCLLGSCVGESGGETNRFGEYEILDEGKEGGMGVVHRARHLKLDRIVALKTIRGAFLTTSTQVQRFNAEAEAAASLDYPNIVPIYEIGERDGRLFFTMKWMEGGSLADALHVRPTGQDAPSEGEPRREPLFDFRHSAELLATISRAVHHAHQRGIIHRDLKPSNILLDVGGAPHVTDFGLAKRLDGNANLTLTDQALGTPAYMAPEQAAGKAREVTIAADVYSLGAIFYEMLTGAPPFSEATSAATMQKVLTEEPKRPSSLVARLPRDAETICLKCLEKDPARRYHSAEALAEEVDRWLRGEPIAARPRGAWGRARKWARRKPAVAALTGTVILMAFLGLGGLFWHLKRMSNALEQSEAVTGALVDLLPSFHPGIAAAERDAILHTVGNRLTAQLASRPELLIHLLAHIDYSQGDYAAAEQKFRKVLDLIRQSGQKQLALKASALNGLAVMIQKQRNDRRAEAEPYYREALELLAEIYGRENPNLDEPRLNLAFVLRRLSRFPQSEALYREAYELEQKRHGKFSTDAALKAEEVLVVMLDQGKAAEAEPLARETLTVLEKLWPQSWHFSHAQSLLGGCLLGQKQLAEANQLLTDGYKGLCDRTSIDSDLAVRRTKEALHRLVLYSEAVGEPENADMWNQKIAELDQKTAKR